MGFGNRARTILRKARSIPARYDLRPHRVFLVNTIWTGDDVTAAGDGNRSETEVEILENGKPPKVRQVKDERMALSDLQDGSLEIGPITTPSEDVGITLAQLRGDDMRNLEQLHIRIEGPLKGKYTIAQLHLDRGYHWRITVEPKGRVRDDA